MEINAIATVAFFGVLLAYVTLKENKPQKTASWPIAPLDVRRRALEKRDRELKESEQNRFNEENVRKIQSEFEWRLEETIFWREAYVYRHLMRSWFSALNEKHRYDASMSNKLRADWLSYMSLLEQAASSGFLSRQSCNSEKRSCHKRREMEERTAYMAIEDCFAAQISRNAVETLRQVRESEEDAFDRFGKEKMAPNGHHYLCVSFNPYKEELRPRTNCASLLGRMTYD